MAALAPFCSDKMKPFTAIGHSSCSLEYVYANFQGSSNLSCKSHVRSSYLGNHYFLSIKSRKGSIAPSGAAFAVAKDNNKDREGPCRHIDDPVPNSSKAAETSQNKGGEAISSLLDTLKISAEDAESLGEHEILLDKLKAIHLHILAIEQWNTSNLRLCHSDHLTSATNLVHYMALKSLNIEQLKVESSFTGLLNLESIKSNVLASLSSSIQILENLNSSYASSRRSACDWSSQGKISRSNVDEKFMASAMVKRATSRRDLLLGRPQGNSTSHIMVTVGQEVLANKTIITDLIDAGTSIIRINCAHGNPGQWSEIIRMVKCSSQKLEKPCKILMDLAGPKLRTDKLEAGPCVVKISPKKNSAGDIIYPALVWLSIRGMGPPPPHVCADETLYVEGQEFLSKLEINDNVQFVDARGKHRYFKVLRKFPLFSGVGILTECRKSAYVESGTELRVKAKGRKGGFIVDVPPVEQFVRLRVGDLLIISRDGFSQHVDRDSFSVKAQRIICSSSYLFDSVKHGESIAFDDGKIWGVVKGNSTSEIIVSITHAGPKGTKLGSEKSINIPQSEIKYEGLTSKDLVDLDFVATHADMVGISFIRDVRDIVVLHQELRKRSQNLGVVLKVETRSAFEKLPLILLEAMKCPNPLGVMIARGDLAVECGWEMLGDMQEEILSVSSAAHVPVIWATQVLESLVKSGVPTRAEITDVAQAKSNPGHLRVRPSQCSDIKEGNIMNHRTISISSHRASCIMLNKGKHVLEAVSFLRAILSSSGKTNIDMRSLYGIQQ